MSRIILHVGLIKTGTTFLQAFFFPHVKEVDFVGFKNLNNRNVICRHQVPFLISNEGMSGTPLASERLGLSYFEQFENLIGNISAVYNNPRLIIGFREPASLIQSIYKQYLHEGGTENFENVFNTDSSEVQESFYLSRFIEEVLDKYDMSDLFFYDYDELKTTPNILLKNMLHFISPNSPYEWVDDLDFTRKANPSIPYELEGVLLNINAVGKRFERITGRKMRVKIFGNILSGRVLIQYFLARFVKPKKKRDLSELQEFFAEDWERCLSFIKETRRSDQFH